MKEYAIIPKPVCAEYRQGTFECAGIPGFSAGGDFESEARVFTRSLPRFTATRRPPPGRYA